MSDSKENEVAGQGVPSVLEDNQQLVDADVQTQPEAAAAPVMVAETSNHDENESNNVENVETLSHVENGSNNVENLEVEPPAEEKIVQLEAVSEQIPHQDVQSIIHSVPVETDAQISNKAECEEASDVNLEAEKIPQSDKDVENHDNVGEINVGGDAETAVETKPEACGVADSKTCDNSDPVPASHNESAIPEPDTKAEINNVREVDDKIDEKQATEPAENGNSNSKNMFFLDADHCYDGNESGTEEEQSAFMRELENFFRERSMEFKPPKFYGEGLNCLKLWRAVTRLGGYDKVTSCKLWRQVGESFKPPK